MKQNEMFGEISFLEGGGASVTVVADEDGTELSIIEGFSQPTQSSILLLTRRFCLSIGYYINILFTHLPGFAGRFFNYLCTVLAARLQKK